MGLFTALSRYQPSLVEQWFLKLLALTLFSLSAAAQIPVDTARLHFNRNGGDYAGWAVYTWTGAATPSASWAEPQQATGTDSFGIYFDVKLTAGATKLNYIIRNADGSTKNCPADLELDVTKQKEAWHLQDNCTIFFTQPQPQAGNIAKQRAHFVTRDTILWPGSVTAGTFRLYYSATGSLVTSASGVTGGEFIAVTVDPNGASAATRAKFPTIGGATALRISAADASKVPAILRGQIAVTRFEGSSLKDATGLQIPGAVDDLYTYRGRLGALTNFEWDQRASGLSREDWLAELKTWIFSGSDRTRFRLWAPTARSVNVVVYPDATSPASTKLPTTFDPATGVWSAVGKDAWVNNAYYQYEVEVYQPTRNRVETSLVTDPYSLSVSTNSERSFIVDLQSRESQPRLFAASGVLRKPIAAPEDIVLYELHVRDFSATDNTVPAADRGKYKAFARSDSDGMKHLKSLADAGLTHIHLLPAFDIASIPERNCVTPAVPSASPDSTQQQAAINPVKDSDCFNWGYDPVHYGVPEGSYASEPDGLARVFEFREMVQSLHLAGLRVVMDVVYNHTSSAGSDRNSVFDRITPGYYYRYNDEGGIESSTCCPNIATERAMMAKLMIDTLIIWARDYHVDGFRFDIMGHIPRDALVQAQTALKAIDPSMYLYGEGWNFGEVANDRLFVQGTQRGMVGTGIGTFNDRMRDGVRGGGPFDGGTGLISNQGFINGLHYDQNESAVSASVSTQDRLAQHSDWIRVGLTANLKDYTHVDRNGSTRAASNIDYNGQQAGYTVDPQETINYASAHDNQTLFDINQYKLPKRATAQDRLRANNLANAIVMFAQGIPFFHAGDETLRSKSLDRDSYNSGDWFNRIDWTMNTNYWGTGLPPEFTGNKDNWSVMAPLLTDPRLQVSGNEIKSAAATFKDYLKIRKSTPLFRLQTASQVINKVRFFNTGPSQVPGVIVMHLTDETGESVGGTYRNVVVVFNASTTTANVTASALAGKALSLHPVQSGSTADAVVKQATFTNGQFSVPARTTAVFVEAR